MKTLFINKTIQFLSKYQNYSEEEKEKLSYGLEGIYLTYTKMIIILLLALILDIFIEVIGILFFFNIIRYFGFGIHAKKSSECLISSIFCFIVLPYVLLNINLNNLTILIISIICTISFILFAPADTIKRPLNNKRKRMIRKILTTIIGLIYLYISYKTDNKIISTVLISSTVIESLIITPISYKAMGLTYNNYKNV